MGRAEDSKRVYSRREILKGAPLTLAAGFVLSAVAGSGLVSRLVRRRRPPVFPEGSIFTPARRPRDKA